MAEPEHTEVRIRVSIDTQHAVKQLRELARGLEQAAQGLERMESAPVRAEYQGSRRSRDV